MDESKRVMDGMDEVGGEGRDGKLERYNLLDNRLYGAQVCFDKKQAAKSNTWQIIVHFAYYANYQPSSTANWRRD
jgi:hypothetical protein